MIAESSIEFSGICIHEMIDRGDGGCRSDDRARYLVISMIPDFLQKVSSLEYLKEFSVRYFKNDPQTEKIQEIFEKSINTLGFKAQLSRAVEDYQNEDFRSAEKQFRIALSVFSHAKSLEEPKFPAMSWEE